MRSLKSRFARLKKNSNSSSNRGRRDRFTPFLEALEARETPATFAVQVFDDGIAVPVIPFGGQFIAVTPHFSVNITSGSSNNPGTPPTAQLGMGSHSVVQATS